jgi:hypothetical protein
MKKLILIGFAVCLAASTAYGADVVYTYSWEDGPPSTILGSYGNVADPTNVSGPQSGDDGSGGSYGPSGAYDGTYYLHVAEEPHSGTPQAYVACITGLQEGDSVLVSMYCYDVTPGTSPSGRLWGGWHDAFSCPECPGGFVESAGAGYRNSGYSAGNGWDLMEAAWDWAPPEGTGALIIQFRLYSSPSTCETCRTDFWADLITVTIPDYGHVLFPDLTGPSAVEGTNWGGIKGLFQ